MSGPRDKGFEGDGGNADVVQLREDHNAAGFVVKAPVSGPRLTPDNLQFAGDALQAQTGELGGQFQPAERGRLPVEDEADRLGSTAMGSISAALQARSRSPVDPDAVQRRASSAFTGIGTELPHRDVIQASFGAHSLDGVQAFVGGSAATANKALGSSGFAMGDQIALKANPDIKLAAHEAAHVVQQRSNLNLPGGVGSPGDVHEQHADAVADKVVQGRSAEPLLNQYANPGGTVGVVQAQTQFDFTPEVSANPTGRFIVDLNDDIMVNVTIDNASEAPEGAQKEVGLEEESAENFGGGWDVGASALVHGTALAVGQQQVKTWGQVGEGATARAYGPCLDVEALGPDIMWVVHSPTGGDTEGGPERSLSLAYGGDEIQIEANVSGVNNAEEILMLENETVDGATDSVELEIRGNNAFFDIKLADKAGTLGEDAGNLTINPVVKWPTVESEARDKLDVDFTVVSHLGWLLDQLQAAEDDGNVVFHDAKAQLFTNVGPYKSAFEAFNSALKEKDRTERLVGDILIGIFFAGVSGAAGPTMKKFFMEYKDNVAEGLRDIGKYLIKLGGSAVEIKPSPQSGGADPVAWVFDQMADIEGKKAILARLVRDLRKKVKEKWKAGEQGLLNQDPAAMLAAPLAQLQSASDAIQPKSMSQYFEAMAAGWLSEYGYNEKWQMGGYKVFDNTGKLEGEMAKTLVWDLDGKSYEFGEERAERLMKENKPKSWAKAKERARKANE